MGQQQVLWATHGQNSENKMDKHGLFSARTDITRRSEFMTPEVDMEHKCMCGIEIMKGTIS